MFVDEASGERTLRPRQLSPYKGGNSSPPPDTYVDQSISGSP